jgi:glycosyltransferase involved in cell wall biosynthesis
MPLTILNVSYPLATVSDQTAGGAEHILATLDAALEARGHHSLVVAPAGSCCRGHLVPTEPVHGILDDRAKEVARARHGDTIRRALDMYPVDVVHMHGIDFMDYLPDTEVPVVVTFHLPLNWYPQQAFSPRPQTHLVCVSQSQAATFPEQTRTPKVIENGICIPETLRAPQRARPYALGLGRICPEKGFHLAMDAAAKCGIRFLLAGKVYEYPEHQEYFSREIRPRLNRQCCFLGPVGGARKQQLLADASCVLIPSLVSETSSLVAMEALASGTPIIAFPAGALSEIVDHRRTGFLVDSVERMADAISEAHSIDADHCRRTAQTRFSAERMANEYLKLYNYAASRMAKPLEVSA